MRSLALVLLPFLMTAVAGCKKQPSPQKKDPEACATDRDCVLTKKRLKQCCDELGAPHAAHRSRVAAIKRWRRVNCKPGTYGCLEKSVKLPRHKHLARCSKSRCVTVITNEPYVPGSR